MEAICVEEVELEDCPFTKWSFEHHKAEVDVFRWGRHFGATSGFDAPRFNDLPLLTSGCILELY
jgi:hypothetical protein